VAALDGFVRAYCSTIDKAVGLYVVDDMSVAETIDQLSITRLTWSHRTLAVLREISKSVAVSECQKSQLF
jgi:hypothetical protein